VLSLCRKFVAKMRAQPGLGLFILAGLLLLGWGAYWGGRHGWAWYHSHAAQSALEHRDFQEARNHLADCLEVWPDSASTHFLAARTARRCDCFDAVDFEGGLTATRASSLAEAMDHLEAAEQLGGQAEGISLEWDLLRAQQGGLAQVEKKLRSCIQQDHPDSLFILEVLTWELMRAHRLTEALSYLDLWLRQWPDDREARVRRGWVQEHLRNPHDAARDYQKALDLDPEKDQRENDRLRLRLAQLLTERNRPEEAIEHLEVLQERQPENPAVLLALARCRRQLRQTAEARSLLTALLAQNPRDGQALGERGRLALDMGRRREAERWLQKAAARCPHDRQIIYSLMRSLEAQNKTKQAKRYAAQLEQIRSDEREMSKLMREVFKSPNDAELCYRIGKIFLRNGMDRDGRFWLTKALRHDPRYAPAHQALADHFRKIGKDDLAELHRRAFERNQSNTANQARQ
jgi:tetratricopeptide (TPR) repeat protein